MVNEYIRELCGGKDFTAKDFRTWAGTVNAFLAFKELGPADSQKGIKENVIQALDKVASQLGNTRTVCKKYYVHPAVISLYENREIGKYTQELDEIEKDDNKAALTSEERVIMTILQKQ
jgi:DNA topoisomerase-1